MSVTMEGVLRIIDKATGPMEKIDRQSKKLDKTLDNTGKITTKNTSKMGADFERMEKQGKASLTQLTAALKLFEKQRATAKADVDITQAEAKIRLLKQQIRSVSTSEATAELEKLGLMGASAGASLGMGGAGGLGGAGKAGGGLAGGAGMASAKLGLMVGALVLAAPAVVALSGAVSALAGSLGAAALGAGALGVGGIGALIVGAGSMVAVIKPANEALKEMNKQQEKVNTTIQQYGRNSAQAALEQKKLRQMDKANPGAANVLQNKTVLANRFQAQTTGAREDYFGILNEGIRTANSLLPTFSRIANRSMGSVNDAAEDLGRQFRGPEWRGIFRDLGALFATNVGPLARGLQNVAKWFGQIAVAAGPDVTAMFQSMESWSETLDKGAGGQSRTQERIHGMVDQLKSWGRLIRAGTKLALAFFGAGAKRGGSLVDRMTTQLEKWTVWVEQNPAKIDAFFDRTIDAAVNLANAIGEIVVELGKVADALMPVLNLVSTFTNTLGDAGPGGGLLGPLAALGAYKGLRGMVGKGVGGGLLRGGRGAAAGAGAAEAAGAAGVVGGATATGAAAAGGRLLGRGAARTALRVAGGAARKFAPVGLALGAYDFARTQGTIGERSQAVLSGASFGLIHAPTTRAMARQRGEDAAAKALAGMDSTRDLREAVAKSQARLGVKDDSYTTFGGQRFVNPNQKSLQGKDRLTEQTKLKKLRGDLEMRLKLVDKSKAQSSFNDLINAFDIRWQHSGSKAARVGLLAGIGRQIKKLGPEGKKDLLTGVASWTATMENGTRKQKRIARETKEYIVRQYKRMGIDVNVVNGRILTGSRKEWQNIHKAIGGEAEKARQEAHTAFTKLQQEAVGSLKSMGFSAGEAKKIVSGLEKGGKAGKRAAEAADIGATGNTQEGGIKLGTRAGPQSPEFGARGMRVPGVGTHDKVGVGSGAIAAPGELVVNRHTEARLARHGINLAHEVASEGKLNSNALSRSNTMARGGRVPWAGGTTAYARRLAQRFGLSLGSGYRSPGANAAAGGSPTSDHMKGSPANPGAWDVPVTPSNPAGDALAAAARAAGIPQVLWKVADHYDHVHLGFGGGSGAGGAGPMAGGDAGAVAMIPFMPKLKGQRSRLGGIPGSMSNAANRAMARGMRRRINKAIGAGTGGPTGAAGAAPRGRINRWLTKALNITGHFSHANLNALYGRVMQESGGNPRAINNWDSNARAGTPSKGLIQTIDPTFNAHKMAGHGNIWNPVDNSIAAIRYMFSRYGHIMGSTGKGYAKGGRVPEFGGWYGKGGSFTADKPTLIGVGERGRERVTVTPEGRGGGGNVTVHIGTIHNSEKGDIAKIVKRELKAVAHSITHGEDDPL